VARGFHSVGNTACYDVLLIRKVGAAIGAQVLRHLTLNISEGTKVCSVTHRP